MSAREKQTQIAAMTRLCIFKTMSARAGASNCISYQDLAKVNGDHSKATAALLEETNDRLRQLFGYELRELPASESKQEPALQLVSHGPARQASRADLHHAARVLLWPRCGDPRVLPSLCPHLPCRLHSPDHRVPLPNTPRTFPPPHKLFTHALHNGQHHTGPQRA